MEGPDQRHMSPRKRAKLIAATIVVALYVLTYSVYDAFKPYSAWALAPWAVMVIFGYMLTRKLQHAIWRRSDWESWAANNQWDAISLERKRARPKDLKAREGLIRRLADEHLARGEPPTQRPLLRAALRGDKMEHVWQGAVYFSSLFLKCLLFLGVAMPIAIVCTKWTAHALRLLFLTP
jgi:hypothetical protein